MNFKLRLIIRIDNTTVTIYIQRINKPRYNTNAFNGVIQWMTISFVMRLRTTSLAAHASLLVANSAECTLQSRIKCNNVHYTDRSF